MNKYWYETSENFQKKWPKTEILTYFGAQKGPKIGSVWPIFLTSLKVLTMSMWSKTNVKPLKKFRESDQRVKLWLIWGPKMGFFVHISESSCNEHESKAGVNLKETIWQNSWKPKFWLIWRPKTVQKFGPMEPNFYTPIKVASMSL